ncbi:TonB-dependent siderophore receptor [Azorhizophilus paspali]
MVPLTAQAAETVQTGQVVDFDVPAGPLDQVLGQFGRQAGIPISVNADRTASKRSSGLRGRYSVEQGFERILAGTGFSAARQGDGSYLLIEQSGNSSAVSLDAISVAASNELGATTEDSGSYTTGSMNTATKLSLSIRETPQSVTIITRQRMDDQDIDSLEEAVQETPGLIVQRSGPERPTFYARGFEVDNIMYDGLPTTSGGDYIPSPNTAMYDRIEIVRGATGLVQGAGNPSAAINLVRKRPTIGEKINITGSTARWDEYREEFDISEPLNSSGSLRGRTVASYQKNQSFQDVVENETGLLYGIIEGDLTDNTTFTLGASYQNDNNNSGWGGLPTAANGKNLHLPRSTYLGYNWEYWDQEVKIAFSELEHRFNNGWKLRLVGTKSWTDMEYLGTSIRRNGTGLSQVAGHYKYDYDQYSYDVFANGPFQFLGREHELVIGGNSRTLSRDAIGGQGTVATNIDIYNTNPDRVAKPNFNMSSYVFRENTRQKGIYLATRLSLTDSLKFIIGHRMDWYHYDSKTLSRNTSNKYKITREHTRYAGLIYDIDENHSIYASYTDIFKPQSSLDTSGQIISPLKGKNYELGLKGEYFDGALNTSLAIFQLDQENRAQAINDQQNDCPTYPATTCYQAAGKVRTRGFDAEINGAIMPNWQLAIGYSYVSTKYKQDANEENEGRVFDTDLPRQLFKMTTTYQLPGGLSSWRVGGSLYRQSKIYNKGTTGGVDYYVKQKAYTIADLMINYKLTEDLDARINISNLFDKNTTKALRV